MWLTTVRSYLGQAVFMGLNLVLAIFVLRFFFIDFGVVSGPSMEPNFHDGDYFAVLKVPFLLRPPQRFEVVQLIDPSHPSTLLIKRVIGLPGEIVTFRQNKVCVSGWAASEVTCFAEPYLSAQSVTRAHDLTTPAKVVPDDMYYVLGDNRVVSADSRYFGPVPRDFIIGLVD